MKTKKPRLKHNPIEYLLLAHKEFDETLKQNVFVVEIRTVKEFSNFQYELAVQDSREDSTITVNILGLRTPKTTIPTNGHATYYKAFDKPDTVKKIIVKKMDKKLNSFTVRSTTDSVSLASTDTSPFIEAVTDKQLW